MADRGLRVIGVARAGFGEAELPDIQHEFVFQFIGLIGLEDPIRPAVPAAIAECAEAGIRPVMITGDYPVTAQKIARQIGMANWENVVTGQELSRMGPDELRQRVKQAAIFARVVPEQKLLIVDAFKANGDIVAMTGDGVNDAPALKSAHIGVAMGERGTDVAREASDLVLLDDDFSSIVAAVRLGRRIFDNLKKAMAYIVSVHIPIALASLLPVLLNWKEMLLFPVHIVFLELIIDPACSVVFEAEPAEPDIMKRRPRSPSDRLFGRQSLVRSALQGIVAFVMVFGVFEVVPLPGGDGGTRANALIHHLDRREPRPHPDQQELDAEPLRLPGGAQPCASLGSRRRPRVPRAGRVRARPAGPLPFRSRQHPRHPDRACSGPGQRHVVRDRENAQKRESCRSLAERGLGMMLTRFLRRLS